MSTTHVFIVDSNTFQYHLQYSFAGTGSKDHVIDFNNNAISSLHHSVERNLLGLMADSQRIRKNNLVIFYLQQNIAEGIYEGRFYGVFKVVEDLSFLDNNTYGQFLKEELGKSLTLRTIITPVEVFPEGVTEWEALDEIRHIHRPNQMLWSLIYRKLKGNRGNTMITIYESDRLIHLIKAKNRGSGLKFIQPPFTFDITTARIETTGGVCEVYSGRRERIDILPRLCNRYKNARAFEHHLHVWILQNIGRGTSQSLDDCVLNGMNLEWIGYEVSCGVGMQRIDIVLSMEQGLNRRCVAIEIKDEPISVAIISQMQRYIDWLDQYYIPNRPSELEPVFITQQSKNLDEDLIETLRAFNRRNKCCLPIRIIEFLVGEDNITFENRPYDL